MHPRTLIGVAVCAMVGLAQPVPAAASQLSSYSEKIRPLLAERCFGCHGALKQEAGLRLDAVASMVQRGVRFVHVQYGGGVAGASDAHGDVRENYTTNGLAVDQHVGALLEDLARCGLFDETLVVFATEFGRTPSGQGGTPGTKGATGRNHHPFAFSVWPAGGGINGGVVHGATDELGYHSADNRHYVTDIRATILRQLGLDSRRLDVPGYRRLAVDHGMPIKEIIA